MNTTNQKYIKSSNRNIGIDVGKDTLDIYVYELNLHWQEANSPAGIRRLMNRLKRFQLTRVLVEATGGYERLLIEAATEQSMPIIIVQPIQVRQFARAQGAFAKTDKIDARLIAQYAEKCEVSDEYVVAGHPFEPCFIWRCYRRFSTILLSNSFTNTWSHKVRIKKSSSRLACAR